ncbi:MAG: hypothetical protein CVU47_06350 [Chloroflexi bacterium HGW-Chloroflexi-9]|nr:MAG: hypothetical protein CVU47_06350 [Chloroflexi bacterium HGW-Chloroflexi-9]
MPHLTYTGPDPAAVGIVPLPEGWPALDHDEADEQLAAEKVASGKYRFTRPPAAKHDEQPARRARRVRDEE